MGLPRAPTMLFRFAILGFSQEGPPQEGPPLWEGPLWEVSARSPIGQNTMHKKKHGAQASQSRDAQMNYDPYLTMLYKKDMFQQHAVVYHTSVHGGFKMTHEGALMRC